SNTGQLPSLTYATRELPDGAHSAGVNVATGDALVEHTDLAISGKGPGLALTRTYNDLAPTSSLFGWGWTSDLDEALQPNAADGSVTYKDASGGFHLFLPNGGGGTNFLTPAGLFLSLVKNGDGTYT